MAIQCSFTESDDIKVVGTATKEEAREAAMSFFNEECDAPGITLDNGFLNSWGYDEPQPADWVDSYIFRTVDEYVPPGYW